MTETPEVPNIKAQPSSEATIAAGKKIADSIREITAAHRLRPDELVALLATLCADVTVQVITESKIPEASMDEIFQSNYASAKALSISKRTEEMLRKEMASDKADSEAPADASASEPTSEPIT